MRSVSWSSAGGSRTGTMAASARQDPAKRKGPVKRKAYGNVAAGQRRGKLEKKFGRRRMAPMSRFRRSLMLLHEGIYTAWPFLAVASALLAGAVIYGAFVGGHVAAGGAGAVGAMYEMLGAAGLNVQEITVRGRYRTPRQDVMTALGVVRGEPILKIDVEAARQRLERLEWVSSATVTRLLPDMIHIELVERQPYAIWQRGGRLALVDRFGHVITESGLQGFRHLPMVVGFGAARHAAELIDALEREPELYARIQAMVRVADRRWNLRLENGVDVKLPETGINAALRDIVALDREKRILSRDIQAIDLRLPDRLTIKLTPEAAAQRKAAAGADAPGGQKEKMAEHDT